NASAKGEQPPPRNTPRPPPTPRSNSTNQRQRSRARTTAPKHQARPAMRRTPPQRHRPNNAATAGRHSSNRSGTHRIDAATGRYASPTTEQRGVESPGLAKEIESCEPASSATATRIPERVVRSISDRGRVHAVRAPQRRRRVLPDRPRARAAHEARGTRQ